MPPEVTTSLAEDQALIIDVIQHGPAAFPSQLFAGSSDRALLGLKAHANTISHARLVALEDTYPRTLLRLGLERFNTICREFIERPDTRTRKLMQIGADFAAFLADQGCDAVTVQLAQIEWAWLESYHSADVPALGLPDLAGLDEAGLLDLPVTLHPACRWVTADAGIAKELSELASGDASTCANVLITRPDAAVLIHALDADRSAILDILLRADRMRNLLDGAIERLGEANALPAIFAFIEAGVLERPGS